MCCTHRSRHAWHSQLSCQNKQASTQPSVQHARLPREDALLSEQTSKHAPGWPAALTPRQNRQASTNSYVSFTSCWPGTAALLSEQTSKHGDDAARMARDGSSFVRTDKQAVIHRLFTIFGKVIHSLCP